jgi:N-acetylglucosamine-6-phosphate deacetylase
VSLLLTGRRRVLIDGGLIAALDGEAERLAADADRFDATGLQVAPGFIDLQINGACGHDFTREPSAIWEVGSALPHYGVTAFLPTIVSAPTAAIEAAQTAVARRPAGYRGAEPLGLHLEGPFLSPTYRGAHDASRLQAPDRALAAGWSPGSGVRMVTLAPELPGAIGLVELLARQEVVVGVGHSAASAPEAAAAIEAGARYATHLFNAMPPLHHRDPGLVGQLLLDSRVTVGLIADGVHVDPVMLSIAWHLAGPDRWSTVTDATSALGAGHGEFTVGEAGVTVTDGAPRLAGGRLAGSVLSLDEAIRNVVSFAGATADEALATVTATPAALLGLTDRGHIEPGMRADLVLLDDDLAVAATFVGGQSMYLRKDHAWR